VIEKSRVRLSANPQPSNNFVKLFTPKCLCYHQAVQFGLGQGAVWHCAGHASQTLCLSTHWLNGLDREMSTPPALRKGHSPLYLYLLPQWTAAPNRKKLSLNNIKRNEGLCITSVICLCLCIVIIISLSLFQFVIVLCCSSACLPRCLCLSCSLSACLSC